MTAPSRHTTAELLQMIIERLQPNYFVDATVVSVDEEKLTIKAKCEDGKVLTNVPLLSVEGALGSYQVLIPKLNSRVKLVYTDKYEQEACVFKCSEIDKVVVKVEEFVINGGENGGLVKIVELETRLNNLVSEFNSHKHGGVVTVVTGGSGAPAVGTVGSSGTPTQNASQFNKADFENEKVKH